MAFSNGSPSLATVVDLFRVMPPRKRDCLTDLDSDFGVGRPFSLCREELLELLMRKKFLILWGRSFELVVCLDELDMPEKFRFSLCTDEACDEELKSWVMFMA